jgi:hypothetical protein
MQAWIGGVAFVVALGIAAKWFAGTQGWGVEPSRAPIVAVPLLLSLAVFTGYREWQQDRFVDTLTAAASTYAGSPVTVKCERAAATAVNASAKLGFVAWGPDGNPTKETELRWETCKHLRGWLKNPTMTDERGLLAVHVLTHEVHHMMGEKNEAVTDCQALQGDHRMARILKAPPTVVSQIGGWYVRTVYPNMPAGYKSSDCAPGGALDQNPRTPEWPDVTT